MFKPLKKKLLLIHWKSRCGIITRKDAKSFYDCLHTVKGLGRANPRFTGMNVIRILRDYGTYAGKLPVGMRGNFIDVWILKEFIETVKFSK